MHWNLSQFLDPQKSPPNIENTYLIILNQPISYNLLCLWNKASVVLIADGGANFLYDFFKDGQTRNQYIPNIICGDFDCIKPSIKSYYSKHGSKITHLPSQDSTDLQKCLSQIPNSSTVLVHGAIGGRFDHTMSSIHTMYKFPQHMIYLISAGNLTVLLRGGVENVVCCDMRYEGESIGLWPMNGSARVFTEGLKWNLDEDHVMAFGEFISTSNTFGDDNKGDVRIVRVRSDLPVVWTIDLKE